METVLVVDDSSFMRRRCVSLVRELGYCTMEACDGRQAVELYRQTRPRAVLMDISLPRIGGLEALRQIIALDPDANVAMVATSDQQDSIYQAIKAGARAFVGKPFKPDSGKAALQKLGAGRRTT